MEIWPQILLGGVVAGVLAQIISGRLSRSVQISKFRQEWIDSLRDDVAAYVGATHKWILKYEEIYAIVELGERAKKDREELVPLQNDALVILSRIKLRINPHKNRYKKEDDAFLRALDRLLEPGKLKLSEASSIEVGWDKAARDAVEAARKILKREWEVTKQPGQWF